MLEQTDRQKSLGPNASVAVSLRLLVAEPHAAAG